MCLETLTLHEEYRTGEIDLIEGFYRPCLLRSERYDRAVGYFRSSVFLLVGPDLLEFAKQGGKFRLICSPCLTEVDIDAIESGYKSRQDCINSALGNDIDQLLHNRSVLKNTEALATLITLGVMEVKIVFRPGFQGIYHEKIGLFSDEEGGCISFKGSVNETWNGWHERGNYETLDVYCSWLHGRDKRQVARNKTYFNNLWEGNINNLDVRNEAAHEKRPI